MGAHKLGKGLSRKFASMALWLVVLILVAGGFFVQVAHAAPPANAPSADQPVSSANEEPLRDSTRSAAAEADEAYQRALEFIGWGLLSDALPSLENAGRLHPHSRTTFMIGICERGLGHDTRARKFLKLALNQSPQLSMKDQATANEVLKTLNARIGRLRITLSQSHATILVDGRPLEADDPHETRRVWVAGTATNHVPVLLDVNTLDVLVDPGTHRVEVFAEGFEPITLEHVVRSGESLPLAITLKPSRRRIQPAQRTLASVFMLMGGVGVAMGVGTFLYAAYAKDMASQHCSLSWVCTPEGREYYQSAQDAARAATVVIPMSVAFGVIPGAILFGTDPATAKSNNGRNWAINLNVGASDRHVEAGLVFAGAF